MKLKLAEVFTSGNALSKYLMVKLRCDCFFQTLQNLCQAGKVANVFTR